jgi:hypothetical protein
LLDEIDREIDEMDEDFEIPQHLDGDDDEDEDEQPKRRAKPDPRDEQIARMQAQLDALSRAIPPAAPARSAADDVETDEFEDTDWDAELFANPKAAAKKIRDLTRKQVLKEMRSEYQQDQSNKDFWKEFYAAHKDLKDDHDLVESTMGKNMSKLANLPVSQAIDQLADLTRDRISRYSKRGGQTRTKATAEGGNYTPGTRAETRGNRGDQPKIQTMSDLINARRLKRSNRSTAA